METYKSENKYVADLIEEKLLKILRDALHIDNSKPVIVPKATFNFLAARIRITPSEILALSKSFKTVRISMHSFKLVRIELRGEGEHGQNV